MNRALPGCPNVLAMRAVEGPYLALVANHDRAIEDQTRELAEATAEWEAPMIVDAVADDLCPTITMPAPDWRYPARDGYFDKPRKADRFPDLAQPEPMPAPFSAWEYGVMFGAVGLMGLIWGAGDVLVRGLIWLATWALAAV